jgi:hypothetical protein
MGQGDSPNTDHVVTALHCYLGALMLSEVLVPSSFVSAAAAAAAAELAAASEAASKAAAAAAAAVQGAGGPAPTPSADGLDVAGSHGGAISGEESLEEELLLEPADAVVVADAAASAADPAHPHLVWVRPSPEAASGLWWTWFSLDVGLGAPRASNPGTAGAGPAGQLAIAAADAHVDLRSILSALAADGGGSNGSGGTVGLGDNNSLSVLERMRRHAWRPPRKPVRIQRDLHEPGAPSLRVDEPAPLPGASSLLRSSCGRWIGSFNSSCGRGEGDACACGGGAGC